MRIGEHRFIDGGAWSSTNLDLLAGQGLDEVFVLAPQASFDADAPTQWATRLERQRLIQDAGAPTLRFVIDLGLVREALLERQLMVKLAPHLVRPLPLVVPAFEGARPDRLVVLSGHWARRRS